MVALPALFFLLCFLALASRGGLPFPRAYLRSAILTGLWMVATTELLSLARALTAGAVALLWGAPVAALLGWMIARRRRLADTGRHIVGGTSANPGLAVGVGVIFGVTALVAYRTPPQTWDSLNYHMPRVAHWTQSRAVTPFATGIEVQNSRSPGAEFAMLHLYLLAGGDRWVNFAQWAAMVGSVVAAAGLAGSLGAPRRASWLAAAFTAALPMGIVQASSTMTDYVTTLWLAAAALEVLGAGRDPSPRAAIAFAGAAAGLAWLTKPTAGPILLALGLLGAWILIRRKPVRRDLAVGLVLGSLALLLLNLGHSLRSLAVFGDPVSGGDQLPLHANERLDPAGVLSNVIRNVGLHAGTPSPHLNKALTLIAWRVHDLLGVDPNDPRTTAHGLFEIEQTNTNENKSGNLVGLIVGAVAVVYVWVRRRKVPEAWLAYLAALIGAFVVFCAIFKWQVFGSRYHLPFFVLLAPLVGAAAAEGLTGRGVQTVAWTLLVGGLPWLLSIDSRPILPKPGEASVRSILVEDRTTLLLANGLYLERPYTEIAAAVSTAGCRSVGLALTGNSAEYPLWWLLGAPRRDLKLEWLVAGTPSARFQDVAFQPCAVVCEGCETVGPAYRGLPLAYTYGDFRLFLAPGSVP